VALALVALAAGFSAIGGRTTHAQAMATGRAALSAQTLDGSVPPPDNCAIGDSWCAYCVSNAAADLCSAFTPAHVSGTTATASPSNTGNQPELGADAGSTEIAGATSQMPTTPGMTYGANNPVLVVGTSWQWCPVAGGGLGWVMSISTTC
jgi:hypothetical protein